MENFKTPLTWVLGIVCVGYLFIANCECGEESTCPLNNGFNINNADMNNGFNINNAGMNNGFNISSADLNNGFNISSAGLNGDVLKVDAPETVLLENILDEGWLNALPEGWSFKSGVSSVEFPEGFVEHLKEQGFTDSQIEMLGRRGEIYDENGEIVTLTEDLGEAEDEEIEEDINSSPTLGNILQNLLEKK